MSKETEGESVSAQSVRSSGFPMYKLQPLGRCPVCLHPIGKYIFRNDVAEEVCIKIFFQVFDVVGVCVRTQCIGQT